MQDFLAEKEKLCHLNFVEDAKQIALEQSPDLEMDRGQDLMAWRKAYGINRPLFARLAGFSERSLASYEKSDPIPSQARRPITEVVLLLEALRDLAGDDHRLKDWLQQKNPAFQNQSPQELILHGKSHLLWEMVIQLRLGVYA